jgi:hypothetical protein
MTEACITDAIWRAAIDEGHDLRIGTRPGGAGQEAAVRVGHD